MLMEFFFKIISIILRMKVKVLCRNPEDYVRETKKDIYKGNS